MASFTTEVVLAQNEFSGTTLYYVKSLVNRITPKINSKLNEKQVEDLIMEARLGRVKVKIIPARH